MTNFPLQNPCLNYKSNYYNSVSMAPIKRDKCQRNQVFGGPKVIRSRVLKGRNSIIIHWNREEKIFLLALTPEKKKGNMLMRLTSFNNEGGRIEVISSRAKPSLLKNIFLLHSFHHNFFRIRSRLDFLFDSSFRSWNKHSTRHFSQLRTSSCKLCSSRSIKKRVNFFPLPTKVPLL